MFTSDLLGRKKEEFKIIITEENADMAKLYESISLPELLRSYARVFA